MAEWCGSCRVGHQATGRTAYRLWAVVRRCETVSSTSRPGDRLNISGGFPPKPVHYFFVFAVQ